MSVLPADLKFYLTGGANNADPNLSLGGTGSSVEMSQALHGLFDAVSAAEAQAGDVEYRAIDLKNTSLETAYSAVIYINQQTSSPDTDLAIGYDAAGVQTVVNENTPPVGVAFSAPASKAEGIALGDIASGGTKRIWVKYNVTAGAAKLASDLSKIGVACDTV